ncbi:major facilitator superfamily domain-containing protein [Lactifluus volemus]|nr:major facilitator superfamily domain-containing protein [Lactifluus volemus]
MQREPNDHRDRISKSASPLAGDGAVRQLAEDRTEALMRIDEAPFSWSHLKACLIAGIGFFTEAYDVFAINQASLMLGHVYGHTIDTFGRRQLSTNQDLESRWFHLWEIFSDSCYLDGSYGMELIVIITATFAQALVGVNAVVGVIATYRFIMGVGIGGGHPLSAVTTSKFASRHIRGRLTRAVFTSQGWGIFVMTYKDSVIADSFETPTMWTIAGGFSSVTMDIDRVVQRAKDDIDSVLTEGANLGPHWVDPDAVGQHVQVCGDFMQYFGQWRNFWRLFGVAYSWFAVAFYGLALNSSRLLSSPLLAQLGIGAEISQSELNTSLGLYKWLRNVAVGSLIVSVAGLLSSYYATIFLIDRWGRKQLQILCFSMLTIVLTILARIYPSDNPGPNVQNKAEAFVGLCCLANFFAHFGSNPTAFIVLGELFPTHYHSTIHGIFAATGMLGAIVSQIIFFEAQGTNTV